MAIYHVKSTGTKVSGASIADDWSDANSYALFSTAIGQSGDGDTVILDDEGHVEAGVITGTNWDGTQTFQSRSSDPELCSLSISSATARFFYMNSVNAGYAHFKNIKISRSVTVTGTASTMFYTTGNGITGVLFENCIIGDFDVNVSSAFLDGIIYRNASINRVDKVRFLNCTIRNITSTSTLYSTLTRFTATQTGYFEGCLFHGLTINNGGSELAGFLFFENAHSDIKNCTFEDITFNSSVLGAHRGMLYHSINAYTCKVIGLTLRRFTINANEYSGGMFCNMLAPSRWENIYAEDMTTNVVQEAGDGGVLYLTGNNLDHYVRNIEVHNVNTRSGGAIFCSNGANLFAQAVRIYDSKVNVGGAIYLGYNGNCDINGVYAENVTQYTGVFNHGKCIYARHSDAAPADDVVYNIANVTVVDCVSPDNFTDGIHLQNNHATGTVTANIYNCISRNRGAVGQEIVGLKVGAGAITVTTHSCNVAGGATSTAGTTDNDLTSADPLLTPEGLLPDGSAISGIGVKWWTTELPVDADGQPLPNVDIDIGGFQGSSLISHPFHPLNL